MDANKRAMVQAGEQAVARQQQEIESRQPRFSADTVDRVFGSIINWLEYAELEEPERRPDTREYDEFLSNFWPLEPHLAGVVNAAVSLDKNRGWQLTGGRNTVMRYQRVLRSAEEHAGWRRYVSLQSTSFYTAMVGAVTEVGREGEGGPMRAIWHVDPTRFTMTGSVTEPGRYKPEHGKEQLWEPMDFFRTVSLPDVREEMHGTGFCAVARCLDLARTMYAVYKHDQEQLGAKAPRGLLILHNIREDQWEDAMKAREKRLEGMEREYYGGVAVLASEGIEESDAKLIALSKLPADFNRRDFVELLMAGYSLVFNYDIGTFWGLSSRSRLGSGKEMEVQHRKASGRGYLDFAKEHQDRLQQELPDAVHFEYEERDDEGQLTAAKVALAQAEVVRAMYTAKPSEYDDPLISREEARSMLAEYGIVPMEWTEIDEDEQATDDEQVRSRKQRRWRRHRDRMLAIPAVHRAARRHPAEPIVTYYWPQNRQKIVTRTGYELLRPVSHPAPDVPIRREQTPVSRRVHRQIVLYSDGDVTITEDDVAEAIEEAEERVGTTYAEMLMNDPFSAEELEAFS